MTEQNLADLLAAAARDLGSHDVEHTLEKSVDLAVELIDGCDACAITVVRRGTALETPVSTGELPTRGDTLQYELGEGPCMDAVWQHEVVISPDLAQDERWPTWGRRVVADLGTRSMMCIRLFADEHTLGALNMYSMRVNAFGGGSDQAEGQALAAHIAVAFAAAQEIEGLNTALMNRTIIGQAEGILMERFGIGGDRAFQALRRVSSHTNLKLHRVARLLVETGQLPTP
jgi:transcriptional regulator with GAF, ATPase, and Fis domain